MTARYLSLPATLRDLRTAAAHIEQTLVHLAELGQLLDRIHQRLDMLSPHRSDIGRAPAPFALLFLEQPNFGRVMRRIREALGLTREHLARLSGLATSTVRNLETRSEPFLSEQVRHRVVTVLVGHNRIRPRRKKSRF